MILPVPEGAVFKTFTFDGAQPGTTAAAAERRGAPALRLHRRALERSGAAGIRRHGRAEVLRVSRRCRRTQHVRVTWEQLLPADGTRIDYVLPRTELSNTTCRGR